MIEQSLILIKPDAVKRGHTGEIIARFERAGLKLVAVKLIQADENIADKHYPTTKKWKLKVGNNTLDDCEKYGIDPIETIGTDDPLKVGDKVKQWNKEFLMSGPVLAIVLQGVHAVERVRSLVGPTVPSLAPAGTIRGDFALDSAISANKRSRAIYNLIHSSGDVDEANEEIKLWFEPKEILSYKRVHEDLYSY